MTMTKQEFVTLLREKLNGLPQSDIEERVIFYSEIIDDRIEDGMPEDEAVEAVGSIDDIVEQTISDTPLTRIFKEKIRTKKERHTWQTVLFWVGSPIWLALLISAVAIVFSLWVALWAVVVSLWAADISFAAGALGSIPMGVIFIATGNASTGVLAFAAALLLAGLFILLTFGCKALTSGAAWLTKRMAIAIKWLFVGKEDK